PSTCASAETSALRRNDPASGGHFSAPDFFAFRRLCRARHKSCKLGETTPHVMSLSYVESKFAKRAMKQLKKSARFMAACEQAGFVIEGGLQGATCSFPDFPI